MTTPGHSSCSILTKDQALGPTDAFRSDITWDPSPWHLLGPVLGQSEECGFCSYVVWVSRSVLSLQLPYLWHGTWQNLLIAFLWPLDELIFVQYLEQWLAHGKHSIKIYTNNNYYHDLQQLSLLPIYLLKCLTLDGLTALNLEIEVRRMNFTTVWVPPKQGFLFSSVFTVLFTEGSPTVSDT